MALYLASPLLGRIKPFLVFFGSSLGLLFVVQAVTLVTVSQEALMSHPAIMATAPFSAKQIYWIPRYNVFYEEMGMFLFVLLLWLPYITWCVVKGHNKTADPPRGEPAR
jgi:hypothetical protein